MGRGETSRFKLKRRGEKLVVEGRREGNDLPRLEKTVEGTPTWGPKKGGGGLALSEKNEECKESAAWKQHNFNPGKANEHEGIRN